MTFTEFLQYIFVGWFFAIFIGCAAMMIWIFHWKDYKIQYRQFCMLPYFALGGLSLTMALVFIAEIIDGK